MNPFTYVRPRSVPDALAALGPSGDRALLAGGTCLVDLMKQGVMKPSRVVDLNFVEGMRGVFVDGDGWLSIGATTTLAHVAREPRVAAEWPMLHEAIVDGLTPQLRNAASVGGNVLQRPRCIYFREPGFDCNKKVPGSGCAARAGVHYAHAIVGGDAARDCIATHPSDLCVALSAFAAEVVIDGGAGRRTIPITSLHRLPDDDPTRETTLATNELVVALRVPPQGGRRGAYVKGTEGFALASCATLLEIIRDRITRAVVVLGGVAHKPWVSHPAEAVLAGAPIDEDTFLAAADAATRDAATDVQTAFRLPLLRATIVEAMRRAVEPA